MNGRITTYTHDGLVFDVRDDGPEEGDAVVLLHGFPERSTSWRLVAPKLHQRGLRTLAPDQRGYSRGARPTRRRDYVAGALIGDVAALVDRVGGPVHLVGHDWGAAVGWGVAMNHPDLVRTWTALSVPHPVAFARALRGRQALRSWYMGLFNVPRLPELLASRPGGPFDVLLRRFGMTEADVARFREEIVDDGALPGALMWYRAIALSLREAGGPKVTVPTTFVWSDRDGAIDRSGVLRTADYCAGPYEYVELTGVDHWIPIHAPDACARAILDRIGTA